MLYTLKRWFPNLHLRNLKGDFLGGLTVSIVALPLALAFGVSSGAGAITGLYGAIFVGIFAAIFGGTPSQISGPTGPMTVVMASVFTGLTAQYGVEEGLTMSFTVVMLGGAISNHLWGPATGNLRHDDALYGHFWLYVGDWCYYCSLATGPLFRSYRLSECH